MKQFGLSKNERLSKKKEFDLVYSIGRTLFSRSNNIKATFVVTELEDKGVRIATGVHRKSGKAFWRNRAKRLIRVSYRLNKHKLLEKSLELNKIILIVFSLNSINQKKNKKLHLDLFQDDIKELLERIKNSF